MRGGEVHHEGGLSHGGAGGDDDELGGLESGGEAVQVIESGEQSGAGPMRLLHLVNAIVGEAQEIAQRGKGGRDSALAHGEEAGFGAIHDRLDFFFRGVLRHLFDVIGGADERPQGGLLPDDARVVFHGGGGGGRVLQGEHIGAPAHGFELSGILQAGHDGHQIYGLALIEEIGHRPIEDLVLGAVEIGRLQEVHDARDSIALHEHRAQSRLFGIQILRRYSIQQRRLHETAFLRKNSKFEIRNSKRTNCQLT